jgi:hypothetical protein
MERSTSGLQRWVVNPHFGPLLDITDQCARMNANQTSGFAFGARDGSVPRLGA